MSPENYSYQKDVATDTCQNLIQSTPSLGQEIVLNGWVLAQKYCYLIDEANLKLNLAVMPELTLPAAVAIPKTTTPVVASKKDLSRLLKPAQAQNPYQLQIDQIKATAKSQIKTLITDAKKQESGLTMKAVQLTIGADNNQKIEAQEINTKIEQVKASFNLKISTLMSDNKEKSLTEDPATVGKMWADSGAEINNLLKEEFNQLQLLREQLAAQKTIEKNQINQLWINEQLMKHQIDAAAFAKVV
jgi:hypothetical protein